MINKELNARAELLADGGEKEYLKRVVDQGAIDLLTVTDHMKCAYAEKVVAWARSAGKPVVLPGMEVNFRTSAALAGVRVHVVVILPGECTRETFAKFLPGIAEESARKDGDTLEGLELKDWIEDVHVVGGVCVAAHVESSNGIRCCFRQTARSVMKLMPMDEAQREEQEKIVDGQLRDLILGAGFDAVEIRKPSDRHHYRWEEDGGRELATVLGIDAHCMEDFGRADEVTLMKMTEVGFRGLREAMKFPETRIRFACDLKKPPSPRLLGVSVRGGESSFFEGLICGFSENLNCVIGPRGSGKSALVEALRYTFGYNRTLQELDATNKLSDRIKSLQKATLTDSQIRVFYQRNDGEVRVLEASFDAKQDYVTKVFDEKGKGAAIDDVERSGEYPLRLYGWSEIETLGRDQARQRGLLDRMIPGLKDALEQRGRIRGGLGDNRQKIQAKAEELRRVLKSDDGDVFRYMEYKRDFEELNKENVKACFEEIDLAEAKKSVFMTVSTNVAALVAEVESLESVQLIRGVDKVITQFGNGLAQWWQKEQLRERAVIASEQFVRGELVKIKQNLQQLEQSLGAKVKEMEAEVEVAQEKLRKALSGEPDMQRIADLRQNAKTRLDRVRALRDKYLEFWKELRELLSERRTLEEELERAQNEITGVRARMIDSVQESLNKYMDSALKVEITIRPGRDKSELNKQLETFLRARGHQINRRVQEVVVEKYNPVAFGRLVLDGNLDELKGKHKVGMKTVEIRDNDVANLKEIRDWREHSAEGDIDMLREEGSQLVAALQLQEVVWDDEERILLNGRPVDKLSPGQRSSAMLPLIALAEDSPLVIDQPEDNLDNRLVGQVLVDILAELKEHRQIIVCTHNPNIVVSGDAEQLIVLDAKTDTKGELELSGSIDNKDIVQTVVDLMEGGEEAFRVRKERYGL